MDHAGFIGKTIEEVFPGLANTPIPEAYREVARNGTPYESEQTTYRHGEISGVFEISALQTGPNRMAAFFRDVTERRQAEEALSENRRVLQTLMSNLPGMAYRCRNDELWTMDFVSEGCHSLTEYPPDDLTGNAAVHFADLIRDDHRSRVWEAVQAALAKREAFELTYPICTAGGQEKWVWERGRGVFAADGALTCLEGFITDITERYRAEEARRRLEEQVQHAQKLESLGVLAGGIAHDFNNLLMAILGNLDLSLADLSPASPVRDNLMEAEKACHRAADLCRQMLAYSGKGRFELKRLNLSEVVEEMGHMLEVSISKKAALRYNFAPALPAIEVDPTQMRQIMMNLITNASEAIGGQNGVISISTGVMHCDRGYFLETYLGEELPEGRYVFLEVSDTGCGMDRETITRIFDPFFTPKFTGRGLGLAAVLGIVRGHRGTIKIYSEPNKGTTFKVLFPAVEDAAESLARRDSVPQLWRGEGAVLLVDDEENVRDVGRRMLERIGFEVLTAVDGREALEAFTRHRADIRCVVLDFTMPHMDGDECFRELRRLDIAVPVLLSSGYSEQEVVQRFAGKGLSGFIQKPYRLENLRNLLQQTLEPAGPTAMPE